MTRSGSVQCGLGIVLAIMKPMTQKGSTNMAWTTPKIVEICVGLEINSYACAEV